jgi:hypothetical protein
MVTSRVGTKDMQSQVGHVRVASHLDSGTFITQTFREQSLQGTILHASGLCVSFKMPGFVLLPLIYTVKLRCQDVWKAVSYCVEPFESLMVT